MDLQHMTHVSTSCRVASPVQGPTPRLNMAIVQFNTGDENLQGQGVRNEVGEGSGLSDMFKCSVLDVWGLASCAGHKTRVELVVCVLEIMHYKMQCDIIDSLFQIKQKDLSWQQDVLSLGYVGFIQPCVCFLIAKCLHRCQLLGTLDGWRDKSTPEWKTLSHICSEQWLESTAQMAAEKQEKQQIPRSVY